MRWGESTSAKPGGSPHFTSSDDDVGLPGSADKAALTASPVRLLTQTGKVQTCSGFTHRCNRWHYSASGLHTKVIQGQLIPNHTTLLTSLSDFGSECLAFKSSRM